MSKKVGNYLFECISSSIWSGKVEQILLADKQFINDLDNYPLLTSEKLSNKTVEQKSKLLHGGIIGNTSREFVLNVLALKHLYRILNEEQNIALDNGWKNGLNKFLGVGK